MTAPPDRRSQAEADRRKPEAVIAFDDGPLHVDFTHQEVAVDGKTVDLTPTEYRLLATLVRHQGEVLSSSQLIELAWDEPHGSLERRLVKDTLYRLLDKLEPDWSWQEGETLQSRLCGAPATDTGLGRGRSPSMAI